MADGAGKDVSAVLMELIAQTSRIEAKVDGLVSHERMNEVVNMSRAEWRNDIKAALEDQSREMRSERRAEMAELEAKVNANTERRTADLEKRMLEREARDEKIANQVRLTFIGVAAVGVSGIAYALYNLLTHGG